MNYNSVDYWNDGIGYYGAINYIIADRVEGSPQRLQYRGGGFILPDEQYLGSWSYGPRLHDGIQ